MLDRAVCESLTKTIICLVMCVFPSMYILSFLSNPCYDIVAWLSFKDAPPENVHFGQCHQGQTFSGTHFTFIRIF